MTDRARNNAPRTRGRPFAKGNPGRPWGARHRTTVILEKIMADDAEEIMKVVTAAAKSGDLTAAKIIVDRMAPVPRDRPVQFEMPKIATIDDATAALSGLLQSVAAGEITPTEAQAVATLIEGFRRSVETLEHERRLRILEGERDVKSR
jgi:hypothetical protein